MESDSALAIGRLESKIDALGTVLDERLKSLDHKIEFGDRSALQTVQILAESLNRLETSMRDQAQHLREIDYIPAKIVAAELRLTAVETLVTALDRDRSKLIGFAIGVGLMGGGLGAGLVQAFGG